MPDDVMVDAQQLIYESCASARPIGISVGSLDEPQLVNLTGLLLLPQQRDRDTKAIIVIVIIVMDNFLCYYVISTFILS